MIVNMHEAKSQLSKLVELAAKGEEVIIAKAGHAVAMLKPYQPENKIRKPGRLKSSKLDMSQFDEADGEIAELFGTGT